MGNKIKRLTPEGRLLSKLQRASDRVGYYDRLTKIEQSFLRATPLGARVSFLSECRQLRKDLLPLKEMMRRHPTLVQNILGTFQHPPQHSPEEEAFLLSPKS